MKRAVAAIAWSALLLSATSQAQLEMTPGQIGGPPTVLWPSGQTPPVDTEPLEGWTWTPQEGTTAGRWALPPTWPPAAGWSPATPPPPVWEWPAPEGWASQEEWERAAAGAMAAPLIYGGATVIGVVVTYAEGQGVCWYNGRHSEGAVRDGQRCVCKDFLYGLFRRCTWADDNPQ